MKKYLLASILVLFLGITGFSAITAETKGKASKTEDLACVRTAVEKREVAMQTGFDKFTNSMKSALETRKSELSAAWTITDKNQRQVAIKAAWDKFKEVKQGASKVFRQERDAAWKQFAIDRKTCKALPTGESPGLDLSL